MVWADLPSETKKEVESFKDLNQTIIKLLESVNVNEEDLEHGRDCSSLEDLQIYLNILGDTILKNKCSLSMLGVLISCFTLVNFQEETPTFKRILEEVRELV